MFTLEINGKPVAMTDAAEKEARELFEGEDFKEDLMELESEGHPLWDGSTPITVRPSSDEEIKAFAEAMEEGDDDEEADSDDEDENLANVLFLVTIDDEDEDDTDEEGASDASSQNHH